MMDRESVWRWHEQARRHFAAAEEARAIARRDMVWTDGDEAQTQALLGIGQILMKIDYHLDELSKDGT